MNENTYLEQYINRDPILSRDLHDWLIDALKEMKKRKYKRKIKKIHKFINYAENNGAELELYQKVIFEIMVINDKNVFKELNRIIS